MARPVTTLVVFFLAFQLFAVMLSGTGAAGAIGVDVEVGEDSAANDLTDQNELPTGSPSGGTLFGMYNVIGGFLSSIYDFVFPGLRMLNRAGVPMWITDRFLGDMFSLLIVIDVAAFVRGYDI